MSVMFSPEQRERFRRGELREKWYNKYPELFDERDFKIATNQPKYHFFEWLAAIILYDSTGFLSFVEQYEFKTHSRKQAILIEILPESLFSFITDHSDAFTHVQNPDLFVYSPDYTKWFFCEVKGPGDRISPVQSRYFNELYRRTGRAVRVVNFAQSETS